MSATFDHIAAEYDADFTHTAVGKFQRDKVWQYLSNSLASAPLHILEVNCGTGEDAHFLAKQGHQVMATDVSSGMVQQAKQKSTASAFPFKATTCSIQQTTSQFSTQQFDLVFSNFGGLNCISPEDLVTWAKQLPSILQPKARIIAVIMPTFCLWESAAYLKKLQFKEVFRRNTSKALMAQVGDEQLPIWYYSPKQIAKLFAENFQVNTVLPIGFFLPPSYLDPLFHQRKKWLQQLNQLENGVGNAALLAGWSDHYLIELVMR